MTSTASSYSLKPTGTSALSCAAERTLDHAYWPWVIETSDSIGALGELVCACPTKDSAEKTLTALRLLERMERESAWNVRAHGT